MAFVLSEEDPFGDLREKRMAECVTRHALIPLERGFEFLLSGVDSLDLGVYVDWKSDWNRLLGDLQGFKERVQGKKGLIDKTPRGRKFLHLPSGKPPNYRYHLQFAEYHLYISVTNPPGQSPNVYISLNSKSLWGLGVAEAVALVTSDLREFGGEILKVQPSRCDICVDWELPGGLSLDFLMRHKVSRSRSVAHHATGEQLETFYVGSPGAQIRLRIYDKGKEIAKSGKAWFLDLWGREQAKDVWRVEFQLRRTALKQFGVDTLGDLLGQLGSIWKYLTGEWFSLRLPDHDKQERRTVHPWWVAVQQAAGRFGGLAEVCRVLRGDDPAPVDWYVTHIGGCLPSYAARMGIPSLEEALLSLMGDLTVYWYEKDFFREFERRSLMLGCNVDEMERNDDEMR